MSKIYPTRTKYVPKADNSKIINGYKFIMHHDNFDREKRARNGNSDLYAFWGCNRGLPEDAIYWATKKIARNA